MAKKSKNKKNRILRKEIEILKAQLTVDRPNAKSKNTSQEIKVGENLPQKIELSTNTNLDVIKSDLAKSFILALFGFGVIIMLWAYENNMFSLIQF